MRCKRDDAESISNAERAALPRLRDLGKGRVTHESAVPRLEMMSVLGTLMSMAIKHVK